jgi:putative flippase GtrA
MIIMGLATLIAVLVVLVLLGVPFWASLAIAVICALVAQFITGRQVGV